jgi:hypothetical protein
MLEQIQLLIESFKSLGLDLWRFLPRLIMAVVLLAVGWLVAKGVRKLTIRGLRMARVDEAAEKAGFDDFLVQGGVRYTTVTLVANAIYWLLTLGVTLAVLSSLGLHTATDLFARLVQYIPNVIATIIILIFGTLFAQFVQTATYTYLSNLGVTSAGMISSLARIALIVFVVSISLEQLSIGGQVLVSAFQIAFGALCFGVALAFGLGGRDAAARILDSWLKK